MIALWGRCGPGVVPLLPVLVSKGADPVKFKSAVYTQASGSIGGITYSHNKGGMYTRSRATPTNPNTSRQQAIRSAMGGVLSYWTNVLTQTQRNAWDTYAANTPVLDKLGELRNLSGQQMFLRSNLQRVVAGISIIADGPTMYDTGETVAFAGSDQFEIVSSVFDSTYNLSGKASGDGHALLFIGDSQPASRVFFKGPYQYAGYTTFAADATSITYAIDTTGANWHAGHVPADAELVPVRIVLAYVDGRYGQAVADILPAAVS